jgi:glutamate/tyrosine decarboxylase-like PLP-dependent enzyme
MANAERAEAALRATPGWEIVTPAQLAIVTFAHERVPSGELAARAVADGYATPTSTVLRGRGVLRLCLLNPRTTDAEIDATVARLTELAG